MNCFGAFYQAAQNTDNQMVTKFISDSSNTMNNAFSLMELEAAWMGQLESDRIQYVMDSISFDPSTALKAQADQVQYNTDSMKKDSQCNLVQISVKTAQAQVNSDNSNRQANYSTVQAVGGALAFSNGLIRQKY